MYVSVSEEWTRIGRAQEGGEGGYKKDMAAPGEGQEGGVKGSHNDCGGLHKIHHLLQQIPFHAVRHLHSHSIIETGNNKKQRELRF